MVNQFINMSEDIENWLKVWKASTRPVWDWLASLVGYELPNWTKDYLTLGVIHGGMTVRFVSWQIADDPQSSSVRAVLIFTILVASALLWPFAAFLIVSTIRTNQNRMRLDIENLNNAVDRSDGFGVARDVLLSRLGNTTVRLAQSRRQIVLYVETIVYAAILIAISGALVLAE